MYSELNLDKTEEVMDMMVKNATEARTSTDNAELIAEYSQA
jgi:hypothetical protein